MRVIVTPENINKLIAEQLLLPAAHINDLIEALVVCAKRDNYAYCTIKIHYSLLADSYSIVPAMLGRSLIPILKEYPRVQSFRAQGSDYITLHAGRNRQPTTFRQRAIKELGLKGEFKEKRMKVPQTYRYSPRTFVRVLEKETQKTIDFDRPGQAIIRWFVV